MKKAIAIIGVVALLSLYGGTVSASEKKTAKKSKSQSTAITLSNQQFMQLLEMATKPQATTQIPGVPGEAGKPGVKGDKGDAGPAGATGSAGIAGAAGQDGLPGRDGAPGRDGVGFAQGAIFLVNGACPAGTTVQGPQNRWTVYANDTSGRPWTTTGSSAQLFLSACQVD